MADGPAGSHGTVGMAKPCGPLKYRETPERSPPGPGPGLGDAAEATEAVMPMTSAHMAATKASLVTGRREPDMAMVPLCSVVN
ncbi:hypothetical protein ACU4GG_04160 [Streptomyces nojiriensis]